jgi:hypothetical protein
MLCTFAVEEFRRVLCPDKAPIPPCASDHALSHPFPADRKSLHQPIMVERLTMKNELACGVVIPEGISARHTTVGPTTRMNEFRKIQKALCIVWQYVFYLHVCSSFPPIYRLQIRK